MTATLSPLHWKETDAPDVSEFRVIRSDEPG